MTIISTETLQPHTPLSPQEQYQTYCGLDNCVTLEVLEELRKLHPAPNPIYNFERALQAPYLEMMQRGFRVDELSRRSAITELEANIARAQALLDEFAMPVWDKGLNPRSPAQLKEFFYRRMHLPEIWINQRGERKLSTNREALEKLDERYLHARPFVSLILDIRDWAKQRDFFTMQADPDGRIRTSYNIAGTETGRPSSSSNAYGTGGNLQNVAPSLRYVMVADHGWKLASIDLEQVEARDVGFFCGCLFARWGFLDSCEHGDLHTNVTKMVWPELPWTGEGAADRRIAEETIYYRDWPYRFMSKRAAHLSNYMGSPYMGARVLKVPVAIMEDFQARYCRGDVRRGIEPAFPEIAMFWQWCAQQLQTSSELTTAFGRRRHFFGRSGDDATLREAIAFMPQSTTADRTNLVLWRIWRYMPEVQVLAQTFDSVTFQYHEDANEDAVLQRALELFRVDLIAPNGRKYTVPAEAKVGWNWGSQVTQVDIVRAQTAGVPVPRLNLDGLIKWKLGKPDLRKRHVGLDRVMQ